MYFIRATFILKNNILLTYSVLLLLLLFSISPRTSFVTVPARRTFCMWKSVESINVNRNRCSLNISHCYYMYFFMYFYLEIPCFFSILHLHLPRAFFITNNPVIRIFLLPFISRDQILWQKCELLVSTWIMSSLQFFLLFSNKQNIKFLVKFFSNFVTSSSIQGLHRAVMRI